MKEVATKLEVRQRLVPAGNYEAHVDALDFFIVDMQLHAQKANNPASLVRNIAKSAKSHSLKRTHTSIRKVENGKFYVDFNFDTEEVSDLLKKSKKRILRIYVPTTGLPVHLAQDALERLRSLEKQHLLAR